MFLNNPGSKKSVVCR